MVRFADAARISLDGLPRDVDHHSPLEKQVAYVWQAMRQYAERNNWETYTHGRKPGHKGLFTMRYFIENLFPRATKDERLVTQQIVSRVLRQTGAGVCIYSPNATELSSGGKPVWYVSDTMPDNLIVVATHHKAGPTPGPPDRLTQVANKLTPHEAGEDRAPGPVTVSQLTQETPEPSKAERDVVINDEFVQNIFEQVATCPVPVTIPELMILTDKPAWACRHAAERMVQAGKLVWRSETKDEKRVRGGGQLPPARPSRLYWPAPGPVPTRTVLPPGIEPVKSSADHAQERVAQRAADDRLIHEYLGAQGHKLRTSGRIADQVGLPVGRVKDSLLRQLNSGALRRSTSGSYYHADAPQRASVRPVPTGPVTWQEPVASPPPPPPIADEPSPVRAPQSIQRPPTPESLTGQIHRLVDELAKTDAVTENRILRAKVSVLEQKVRDLEGENAEMSGTLAKFRSMLD